MSHHVVWRPPKDIIRNTLLATLITLLLHEMKINHNISWWLRDEVDLTRWLDVRYYLLSTCVELLWQRVWNNNIEFTNLTTDTLSHRHGFFVSLFVCSPVRRLVFSSKPDSSNLFTSAYSPHPTSRVICFIYSNLCLPPKFVPSTVTSNTVWTISVCIKICATSLFLPLMMLPQTLTFSLPRIASGLTLLIWDHILSPVLFSPVRLLSALTTVMSKMKNKKLYLLKWF